MIESPLVKTRANHVTGDFMSDYQPEKLDEDLEPIFNNIYASTLMNELNTNLVQGLKNLNNIPEFTRTTAVNGKEYTPGVMGLRNYKSRLSLAVACGTAQVRYIDLEKFIAMIEKMHDPDSATIMLQNFQDQEDYKSAKGQILGRINPEKSAIHIIQGLTGRIIRSASDIALFDVYYIDRVDLTTYYLAAKCQIGNTGELDNMIATYEGWKAYEVPLDPLNPYKR
jgi:hypothetical protein